jgi:hypothetical protein
MTELERETGMTDDECAYWDEYYTTHTARLGPNLLKQGIKPGSAHKALVITDSDGDVADFLRARAESAHQTPEEIVISLLRKEMSCV